VVSGSAGLVFLVAEMLVAGQVGQLYAVSLNYKGYHMHALKVIDVYAYPIHIGSMRTTSI
jgi:hypothetical protein